MALIGISACGKLEDYRQAVIHVGGEVRILERTMTASDALNGIGGLLLTGGGDVEPARYGEEPHPSLVDVQPLRDEFEIALVREARSKNLPIFAICRGLQVLNVAFGGTLVQDIPSQVPGALEHRLAVPPHEAFALAHEVWIDKDTKLAGLMSERLGSADTCEVNSRHHQAVKQVAPNFHVSATAPDGVIEAIEDPSAPFCLAVQWHPENFWRTGEFRPLFETFVETAQLSQNPKS
jgi:putative glutamine amidotransferase